MPTERAYGPRREVLWADFDALSSEQASWWCESPSLPDHAADQVRKAIAEALSEKQREVVEAYFFEGRSQGEIARALGIRQQVVNKRLFGVVRDGKRVGGALLKLREALRAVGEP